MKPFSRYFNLSQDLLHTLKANVNAPCLAALFSSANFIGNLFLFLSLMEFYQFQNLCKDVRRMWPCFRGIRAGRRVRERANRCRYPIEVQLTNRINHSRSSRRHRNMVNCITISPSQQNQQGARKVYVPSVLLSNVMSLASEVDEVSNVITNANLDIACITETWLRDHIHDNVVCIPGYNLVRGTLGGTQYRNTVRKNGKYRNTAWKIV